jgi:hypothetical protein
MQLCVCGDASKGSKENAKNKNSGLLGGKTTALQAAQLAVQSKVQREKEVKESISDIGSDQYDSDNFLTESSYFAKPGKNSRGLPESQLLIFFSLPQCFRFPLFFIFFLNAL